MCFNFSPNNEKPNVELVAEGNSTEENTVKTYGNRRKPKKMGITKKKPAAESEELENFKENIVDVAAAHFSSDSSKYNTKLHPHYNGKTNIILYNIILSENFEKCKNVT